jgi:lysozyme family protein
MAEGEVMSVFDDLIGRVLTHEGGYVSDPRDPGGETRFGIAKRSYPNVDIKALTRDDAIAIYRRDFWVRVQGDKLPRAFAFQALVLKFNAERLRFYAKLSTFDAFGRGWINRVAGNLDFAAQDN